MFSCRVTHLHLIFFFIQKILFLQFYGKSIKLDTLNVNHVFFLPQFTSLYNEKKKKLCSFLTQSCLTRQA